jgi:abortive infection bacteriophage resistance protein
MSDYASYDSLMRHMRNTGLNINGSTQKRHLLLMGYYHGYKGYRFKGLPSNTISFTDFSQLQDLVEFDESIKSIMYLPLMQLETAIKSICCDKIVTIIKSDSFSTVFEKAMNKNDNGKNNGIIAKKLKCRNTIYSSMASRYGSSSKIVPHFYDKDNYIPLWGIIEELTLGGLSTLIDTLTPQINLAISKELGLPSNYNTDGKLLSKIILIVKEFRNATAHNKVVFDGRYKEFQKRKSIGELLSKTTCIENISFNSVIDDIVLVIFLMKNLKFNKKTLLKVVNQLLSEIEKLYNKLGCDLYKECLPFDSRDKLIKLKKFIEKKD